MANNNFKKEYAGSMDSKYYFTSENTPAGKIGATASPQSPNQIGELTSRLNQGLKAVEVGAMNQRILDQIPKEHFTEMRRLGELTGSEATLHAPIQDLDLAGFTQQGWDESEQRASVAKLKSVIDRAHLLDSKGNIPITVHAGSFPAQKWTKEQFGGVETETGRKDYTVKEDTKKLQDQRSEMVIVNQDTGQMQGVKYEKKKYITGEEQAWTPERRMDNLNQTSWDQEQLQLMQMKKDLNEVQDRLDKNQEKFQKIMQADIGEITKNKKLLTKREQDELKKLQQEQEDVSQYRQEIYSNIRSAAEEMYNRFNKYKPESKTFEEKETEKDFKNKINEIKSIQNEIEGIDGKRRKLYNKIPNLKTDEQKNKLSKKFGKINHELGEKYNEQTDAIVRNFQNMPAPNTWISADDFAKEKVSDSIAEAASYAFKEYGEDAPIISMENVYPEFALSRGDSLKKTIVDAKAKFTKTLQADKNLSKKKAGEVADKIIGITWDVGHIYMLKKHGYTDEDIKKEAAKVGAHVTHIHLTDNFGFEDSHLPPGEGSVNIKDQLKAIENSMSDERKGKIKSIVEAGEFVANFKEVPHLYALSNLNSPLYTEEMGPTWDSVWDTQGHYLGGFGEIMPQKYFDLYGAPGFAQLPRELGGSAGAADRGRFASTTDDDEA